AELDDVMNRFGKLSMDAWQELYRRGDAKLKGIMEASNFNACREPKNLHGEAVLHDGYRIDLIYDFPNAQQEAERMKKEYEGEAMGYKNCKILSPAEVVKKDPSLTDFCKQHSADKQGSKWKKDASAI